LDDGVTNEEELRIPLGFHGVELARLRRLK
jgi:hypothetical protein